MRKKKMGWKGKGTKLEQKEKNTSMSIWFQATGQLEQPIPEPQERDN